MIVFKPNRLGYNTNEEELVGELLYNALETLQDSLPTGCQHCITCKLNQLCADLNDCIDRYENGTLFQQ